MPSKHAAASENAAASLAEVPAVVIVPDEIDFGLEIGKLQTLGVQCRRPLCLQELPTGASLLSALLGALGDAQVKEVYVVVKQTFYKVVADALNRCKKTRKLRLQVIPVPSSVVSVCDALRQLSLTIGDLTADFILARADCYVGTDETLSNVFERSFSAHAQNKQRDSSCLVTRVMYASTFADLASEHRYPYHAQFSHVSECDGRLLDFALLKYSKADLFIKVDTQSLLSKSGVVHSLYFGGLGHTGIDVFSPKVFQVLSESFDFMSIERDLVPSIVNDELQLNSAYTYRLEFGYCAVPTTLSSLMSLLSQTCSLWLTTTQTSTSQKLALSESIESLISRRDHLGSLARCIVNSQGSRVPAMVASPADAKSAFQLLGEDSSVDEQASCKDSMLGEEVQIESGASLTECVVCAGSVIKAGVCLKRCLVLPKVTIPGGMVVERSVIAAPNPEKTTFDCLSCEEGLSWTAEIGKRFKLEEGDSDSTSGEDAQSVSDHDEETTQERAGLAAEAGDKTRKSLLLSEGDMGSLLNRDDFLAEVYNYAAEALLHPEHQENKQLETSSFRLASNRSAEEVVLPTVFALCNWVVTKLNQKWKRLLQADEKIPAAAVVDALKACRAKEFMNLFVKTSIADRENHIYDALLSYSLSPSAITLDESVKGTPSEAVPTDNCLGNISLFGKVMQVFTKLELVDDEALPTWASTVKLYLESAAAPQTEKTKAAKAYLEHSEFKAYVKWLAEAEEGSESD